MKGDSMKASFESMIDLAKEVSASIVESGQEHMPMLIVRARESVSVIGMPVPKEQFRGMMVHLLQSCAADAYVLVNEAWAAKLSPESPIVKELCDGDVAVHELHPDDREEIVIITAARNDKEIVCWHAVIDSDLGTGCRKLRSWDKMEGQLTGRMIVERW